MKMSTSSQWLAENSCHPHSCPCTNSISSVLCFYAAMTKYHTLMVQTIHISFLQPLQCPFSDVSRSAILLIIKGPYFLAGCGPFLASRGFLHSWVYDSCHSFSSCCCDKTLWQKQLERERVYSGSQFKVHPVKAQKLSWQEVEAAGHTVSIVRNRDGWTHAAFRLLSPFI